MTKLKLTRAHSRKYAKLLEAIEVAKKDGVDGIVVAAPWILGDDYEELTTNMNLIAEAHLALYVGEMDVEDDDGRKRGTGSKLWQDFMRKAD
jgi:hypothetical protein